MRSVVGQRIRVTSCLSKGQCLSGERLCLLEVATSKHPHDVEDRNDVPDRLTPKRS